MLLPEFAGMVYSPRFTRHNKPDAPRSRALIRCLTQRQTNTRKASRKHAHPNPVLPSAAFEDTTRLDFQR